MRPVKNLLSDPIREQLYICGDNELIIHLLSIGTGRIDKLISFAASKVVPGTFRDGTLKSEMVKVAA